MLGSSGFSLLELLCVIAISSILATLGIASWRDLQDRNKLSMTTFEVLQFLNDVKLDANLNNYNQHIHLITSSNRDWCLVAKEAIAADDCNSYFHFISHYNTIELIGLTTTSISAGLIFYGRRNTAKAVTLRLKNRIGESRIIISAQGRIRYCGYRTYLAGFPLC